jgi:hypothetical protein
LVSQKEIKEKALGAKEKRLAKATAEINKNTNKFSKMRLIIGFVSFLVEGIIGNVPGGKVIIFSFVGGLTGWIAGIMIAQPVK